MQLRDTTTRTHGFKSIDFSSLRTRAVCLSLVLLVPLMIFVGASLVQHQAYVMDITEERTRNFTLLIQSEYQRIQDSTNQMLGLLALSLDNPAQCDSTLSAAMSDSFSSLRLVDAQGEVLCSVGTAPANPFMMIDQPVNDGAQTLIATLNLDWIMAWMRTAQLPLEISVRLVSVDGDVIDTISRSTSFDTPQTFDTTNFSQTTFRRAGFIYGVAALETDSYLLVEVPRSVVDSEVNTLFFSFIGWGVVLALMIGGFAWYQSGRVIVKPLKRLDETVNQLARGDFAARADLPHSLAELDELGFSINRLASEFKRDRDALEEANKAETQAKTNFINLNAMLMIMTRRATNENTVRWEAQQAEERKLQFLGMIAHELRTPLTSVKGFATTLLADDVEWKPEQQREFLSVIDEEADLMLDLVEQLLDISQIESGRLSTHMVEEMMPVIIDDARHTLERLTQNHELYIHVADDLPPVNLDPRRIQQVLTNLVSNAAKYSPAGGKITVKVYLAEGGDCLRVDVSDEGPGIAAKDKRRLFKPFNRANPPDIKGVGLGLVICRGIIEAHQGRIWIEDNEPQGTTFSFEIPLT